MISDGYEQNFIRMQDDFGDSQTSDIDVHIMRNFMSFKGKSILENISPGPTRGTFGSRNETSPSQS